MVSDINRLLKEMMGSAENDTERVCTALLFECAAKISELMALRPDNFEKVGDELFVSIPNIESIEYQTSVELAYRKIKLDSSKALVEKMLENPEPSFFSKKVVDKLKQKGFTPEDVKSMRTKELEEEGRTPEEIHEFLGQKIQK
ncbi:hypothetical protein V7O66_03260 [Methanolobus sp. ZRKC3]|uniref:hypothetical protein n=1 Tax=Methanolobus sp. ZRKC3 TaxID=3125786 RepID=UPI003254568F